MIPDIRHAVGASVATSLGRVELIERLGRGKSGYAYMGVAHDAVYTVKFMHDEPCPYYAFGESNKVALEVSAYQFLKELDIPMPMLLDYDLERKYLVREYIDGVLASELIAGGRAEDVIAQLYAMARTAQDAGINLDYFPANFVASNGKLFYIDYEFNPYDAAWDLSHWGAFYWANTEGMRRFLCTGDSTAINQAVDFGIPVRDPFRATVNGWNARFCRP